MRLREVGLPTWRHREGRKKARLVLIQGGPGWLHTLQDDSKSDQTLLLPNADECPAQVVWLQKHEMILSTSHQTPRKSLLPSPSLPPSLLPLSGNTYSWIFSTFLMCINPAGPSLSCLLIPYLACRHPSVFAPLTGPR